MNGTTPGVRAATTRRRLLLGGLAAGASWSAPAIVGLERATAAPGSCTDVAVPWTSVNGSNPYTATASAGNITITVTATASLSRGTPEFFLSGGQLTVAMSGHRIGDFWTVAIGFSHTSGTICSASTTIIDIDRNDRRLGCATNSRFNDLITNLSGAGLAVSPNGVTGSSGVYSSPLDCKTSDTQTLGLTWTVPAGVTSGGFRYVTGAPHNGSRRVDRQLIKLSAFSVCATGGAPISALASVTAGGRRGSTQD